MWWVVCGEPELGKEGIHMAGHPRALSEPKVGEESTMCLGKPGHEVSEPEQNKDLVYIGERWRQ